MKNIRMNLFTLICMTAVLVVVVESKPHYHRHYDDADFEERTHHCFFPHHHSHGTNRNFELGSERDNNFRPGERIIPIGFNRGAQESQDRMNANNGDNVLKNKVVSQSTRSGSQNEYSRDSFDQSTTNQIQSSTTSQEFSSTTNQEFSSTTNQEFSSQTDQRVSSTTDTALSSSTDQVNIDNGVLNRENNFGMTENDARRGQNTN